MIGIFDSGLGGLSILSGLIDALPDYDYLYLGDNALAPYGERNPEAIYRFTKQCIEHLFEENCTIVILACNTASARALRMLQQGFLLNRFPDRRLLGVIRPSAEAIAHIPIGDLTARPRLDIVGSVGIVGTCETIRSNSFVEELARLAPRLKVYQQECPAWASLVESGHISSNRAKWLVTRDLQALFAQCEKFDRILLACTRYTALMPIIESYLPQGSELLTQVSLVATRFANCLFRHPEFEIRIRKGAQREFLTTGDPEIVKRKAKHALGLDIECKPIVLRHYAW